MNRSWATNHRTLKSICITRASCNCLEAPANEQLKAHGVGLRVRLKLLAIGETSYLVLSLCGHPGPRFSFNIRRSVFSQTAVTKEAHNADCIMYSLKPAVIKRCPFFLGVLPSFLCDEKINKTLLLFVCYYSDIIRVPCCA